MGSFCMAEGGIVKIRSRILLVTLATLAVSSCVFYLKTTQPLRESFTQLEISDAEERVQTAKIAVESRIQDVHRKSIDWSNWDDLYNYLESRDHEFTKSNFAVHSFQELKVDFTGIYDNEGKTVFAMNAHRDKKAPYLSREEVERVVAKATRDLPHGQLSDGIFGYLHILKANYSISIRPISDTAASGKPRGWIVFMEYLGQIVQREISRANRREISWTSFADFRPAPSVPTLNPKRAVIDDQDPENIIAFSLIADIFGRQGLVIRTDLPRAISQHGEAAIASLLIHTLGVGLLFGVLMLVLINGAALKPLRRLSRQVACIDGHAEGARVDGEGNDEVGFLAKTINAMLAKLEGTERKLKEHNENLEQLVAERTKAIEHQSLHDALTGLANRALYLDRLEFALKKARRERKGTAAMFIDLDNFKFVNDSLGHEAGDDLLIQVGEMLVGAVRPGDTVARLGGDEFTLVLENLSSIHCANLVAERILSSLKGPVTVIGREVFIGASIGIAYVEKGNATVANTIKNADTAMYRAKSQGKFNYVVFDETMQDQAEERLELGTQLRTALENGEIEAHYQPLIDLKSGRIIGAEALARWNHPTRGYVPPVQFIPLAEEIGCIFEIGSWMLEKACRDAVTWVEMTGIADFCVSVNVSGKQLQRADIVDQVAAVLEATGLPPQNLKLEITESILMEDHRGVVEKMKAIKALGVHLALDDFGTGYSSLSTLRMYPIDTLKIDRTFVDQIEHEQEAYAIIRAIVVMALSMGLTVTAEGIETENQARELHAIGCEIGQGYLFSRPLPAQMFIDKIVSLPYIVKRAA